MESASERFLSHYSPQSLEIGDHRYHESKSMAPQESCVGRQITPARILRPHKSLEILRSKLSKGLFYMSFSPYRILNSRTSISGALPKCSYQRSRVGLDLIGAQTSGDIVAGFCWWKGSSTASINTINLGLIKNNTPSSD